MSTLHAPLSRVGFVFYHGTASYSSWTKFLYKDRVRSRTAVTVTELSDGLYRAEFDTDSSHDCVWELFVVAGTGEVYSDKWHIASYLPANVTYQNGVANNTPSLISTLQTAILEIKRSLAQISQMVLNSRR